MVVKSLKIEATYFSKHDQVGLKIQVAYGKIQVGKTMREQPVIFDSKISWWGQITHISNIVNRKYTPTGRFQLPLTHLNCLVFLNDQFTLYCTTPQAFD
jgi:hypothetical protein